MSNSMKGEVLFVHGARTFWSSHAGLKRFKGEGGKVVNKFSSKITMVVVYDPADLDPARYSMPQEVFDEVSRALYYAREENLPILTAGALTEMFSKQDEQSVSTSLFSEQEKQKKQPMFGHLVEIQPAGVVFF